MGESRGEGEGKGKRVCALLGEDYNWQQKKLALTLVDNVEDGVRCNENEHRQRRLWGLRHSYILFSFFLFLAIRKCWMRGIREGGTLLGIDQKEDERQGGRKKK